MANPERIIGNTSLGLAEDCAELVRNVTRCVVTLMCHVGRRYALLTPNLYLRQALWYCNSARFGAYGFFFPFSANLCLLCSSRAVLVLSGVLPTRLTERTCHLLSLGID